MQVAKDQKEADKQQAVVEKDVEEGGGASEGRLLECSHFLEVVCALQARRV